MLIKDLLNELDSLNLPPEEYVVTSSGPLGVRGLRKTEDLDILVIDKLWQELASQYSVTKEENNCYKIILGNIEILGDLTVYKGPGLPSVEEQIRDADVIEGHRFVKLEIIRQVKKKLGREKDLKDIELIDQYLTQHLKSPAGIS